MPHSDKSKYPILKDEKINHWSKFNEHLKNIKLEGDSLVQLRKFWNAVDTAYNTTLVTNQGIGRYENLTPTYSIKDKITPPVGHTLHDYTIAVYAKISRVVHTFITKETTITIDASSKAYRTMVKHQMEEDGFKLLTEIIISGSPQLGGEARDLIVYTSRLDYEDGEEMVNFYLKAMKMEQEIKLPYDCSGQFQRLK